MPAEAAEQIDAATLKGAVAWSLKYLLDPKRGAGKLPTIGEIRQQFPQIISIDQIENWIRNLAGKADIEEVFKDSQKVTEVLESLAEESQTAKESTARVSYSRPATRPVTPSSEKKVSALGVLAELEGIEPILKQHRQEAAGKISQSLQSKIEAMLPKIVGKSLEKEQIGQVAQEIAAETARETLENVARIQDLSQVNQVFADSLTQSIITHPQIPEIKTTQEELYAQSSAQTDIVQANLPDLEKEAVLGKLAEIAKLKKPSEQTDKLISALASQAIESQHPLATPSYATAIEGSLKQYLATYAGNLEGEILPTLSRGEIPSFAALQQAQEVAHQRSVKIFVEQTAKSLTSQERRALDLAAFPARIANSFNLRPLSVQEIESLGLGFAQPNIRSFTKGMFQKDFSYAMSLGTSRKKQDLAFSTLLAYRSDRLQKEIQEAEKELRVFQNQIAQKRGLGYIPQKKYSEAKQRLDLLSATRKFHLKQQKKFEETLTRLRNLFGPQGLNSASDTAWEVCNLHHKQSRHWVPRYGSRGSVNRWLPSLTFGALAFRLSNFHLDFSIPSVVNYLSFKPIFFRSGQGLSSYSPPLFATGGRLSVNSFRQLTGTIASSVGGIRNVAGTANTIKNLFRTSTMLAKGTTGPIGLLMLAAPLLQKAKGLVRKAVMGAAALGAYLLFMFGLKALGFLAGVAFGLVSGLPLLLVPGVGPFLYVGWTGFWGFYGFSNPIKMFNIVTHPFSWISDTWSFVQGGFGLSGTASAVGGFFGTIGSFFTGLAAGLWGGFTGTVGAAFGLLSGATNFLVGGLSSLTIPASAVAIPVVGGVGAVVIGSTIVGIVTATSFFSNETDAAIVPGENEFFTLTKTASQQHLENPPPDKNLSFTITLTAKDKKLTDVQVTDELRVKGETTDFEVTKDVTGKDISPIPCSNEILPNENCTYTFTIKVDSAFKDTLVINTATAKATPEGESNITDSVSATVTVGIPPAECPRGWPVTGDVSQGPEGATSHANEVYGGYEAIDIAQTVGHDIYATVEGTVEEVWAKNGNPQDQRIRVKPTACAGLTTVNYWHLSEVLVSEGQIITWGQIIGKSGGAPAAHTHYQFNEITDRGFKILPPHIPEAVDRECNSIDECGLSITNAP